MDFRTALTTDDVLGENLMPTHSTSGNSLLDLFFSMGASRQLSSANLELLFQKAFNVDPLLATKAIFYNRDIRGGQGERRSFRLFFRYIAEHYPEIAIKNLHNVVKYGRWDDILIGLGTPIEDDVLDYILYSLKNGDRLCAKWMPREGKRLNPIAKFLMKKFELTPRNYRKLLAGNTKVVETLMCRKEWNNINYEHVPSVAMHKYHKAFYRNDEERFSQFLSAVEKGEKKIHASAIFPHDVIRPYLQKYTRLDRTIEEQWKALPDYMPKGLNILPVCDVSGSMTFEGGLPILVCVALGIYMAERNEGRFHNIFMTFSRIPHLQYITGNNLREKVRTVENAEWETNTDLEAMFRLILDQAVKYNLPESEMPNTLLILSDMQFDRCVRSPSDDAFLMIRRMYEQAGYKLPQVVFWNLRDSIGVPAKFNQQGVGLVSGFSPSILKSIFNGDIDPMKVLLRTLNSERYESVIV